VFIGALAANLPTSISVVSAVSIATGNTIDAVRPAAEAKEISISTHIEAPDSIVRADVERLQQVFWNLLATR